MKNNNTYNGFAVTTRQGNSRFQNLIDTEIFRQEIDTRNICCNGYIIVVFASAGVRDNKTAKYFRVVFEGLVRENLGNDAIISNLQNNNGYAVLLPLGANPDGHRLRLKFAIKLVQDELKPMCETTAAVSRIFYDMDQLTQELNYAVDALEYRVIYGYGAMVDVMHVLNRDGNISEQYFGYYFDFYDSLKKKDYKQVLQNLAQIKKYIRSHFTPDMFRLAYMNIIHCFASYTERDRLHNILESELETEDIAFKRIEALVTDYFEGVYSIPGRGKSIKYDVVNIVEREFGNADLTVAMLAERLEVSVSYLSRYFRDKMGITLSSYIDDTRISKAKWLLVKTDLSVKEIVKKVGYNDINNFNRKFKLKMGSTPTDFRKKCKEGI